jgi:RHS repeat-associated protein
MIPGQSASISPNGNTHLYTGQERDTLPDGSNMDYMHFRFFSASMGRFQKPDSNFDSPLSNPQGWNLYSYVKGNPVNFNDPTGHQAVQGAQAVLEADSRKNARNPIPPSGGMISNEQTTEADEKKLKAASSGDAAAGQAAPQAGGGGGDPKPATSDSQKEKKGLLETIKDKVVNLAQKFAAWAYDAIAGSPPPKNEAGQTEQIKQAAKQDDDYGMSDAVSDLGAKSTAQLKGVAVTGAGEATKLGIAAAEGAITDGAVEALPTGARIVVKGIEAVQAAQDKKNALANTASAKPAESNPDDNK